MPTLARLKPWLEDPARPKVGQNAKYDMHVLANHGIAVRGVRARYAAAVLCAGEPQAARHGQPGAAPPGREDHQLRGGGRQGRGADRASSRSASSAPPSTQPRTRTSPCSCTGRCIPLSTSRREARVHLSPDRDAGDASAVRDGAAPACCSTPACSRRRATSWVRACSRSSSRPRRLPDSRSTSTRPKQIQEVLFEKNKLPVLKKTPSGQPSTDEDVLEELALDYPLPS